MSGEVWAYLNMDVQVQLCFAQNQITHDIDMNVSLILTLSIPEDHFICPRLFPPWIYNWEINIVPSKEYTFYQKSKIITFILTLLKG